MEYDSKEDLSWFDKNSEAVKQHVKFFNKDYDLCEQLEYVINKHGHMFNSGDSFAKTLYKELDGFNMLQMFALNESRKNVEFDSL